jgi:SAM-dependent methyltransferase
LFHPPWDTGIAVPELARAIEGRPAGWALDLGCGTGTNLRFLAEHGWQGTGVDFVGRAVRQARRRLRAHAGRVQVLQGDVTRLDTLPLRDDYDLALDVGCQHSLSDEGRARYAAGLARRVKPGGTYLVYAFLPADDHAMGLTRGAMEAAFAPHFALARYEAGQGRPSAWYTFVRQPVPHDPAALPEPAAGTAA